MPAFAGCPMHTMKTPQFIQLHRIDDAALADEAAAGLRARPAQVSPKFFYDPLGSRLFDAITELAEYYPTRTEAAIFAAAGRGHRRGGAGSAGAGAGAGRPGRRQLRQGGAAVRRCWRRAATWRWTSRSSSCARRCSALQREHPALDLVGVGLDFSARLALPAEAWRGPALVFYPGSSIGNFAPDDALRLLRQARELAAGGALLIGVDLVKPAALLEAAYDDDLGVTAAFNLNLLKHLNRLLGADFAVRDWRHVALFDAAQSRIEMHLEARARHHRALAAAASARFAAGERIHTENSYKWTAEGFAALLRQAGFAGVQHWSDPQGWFGVFLATG